MATNQFFGIDLKKFVAANKSKSNSIYYKPIARTGDLLKGSSVFSTNGESKLLPEFFIAPSRIKIGILPLRALHQLEKQLNLKALPGQADIVELELHKLIEKYKSDNPKSENIFKSRLQQKGYTGKIIQASKNLNHSRLEPADREILSRSNLSMYTYYRAIIGLGVEDVEGIVSNVAASLHKIKRHLNRVLVDMVLNEQNLKASQKERKSLLKEVADLKLSYQEGEAERLILEKYQQMKSGGEMISVVNDFLDSGMVNVPISIDRDTLVENMVNYLLESGFNIEAVREEEEQDKEDDQELFVVKGTVMDEQGQALGGLRVRALDQDFSGQFPLGREAVTDEKGRYEINYSKDDFVIDGKESGGADIVMQVLNDKGEVIHQEGPHRDAPKSKSIDLFIKEEPGPTEKYNAQGDNFAGLSGISMEVSDALHRQGIRTFAHLSKAKDAIIEKAIKDAGNERPDFRAMKWREQAELAHLQKKDELRELQERLRDPETNNVASS